MFLKICFCRYGRCLLALICGCAVITTGPACGRVSPSSSSGPPPPPPSDTFYVSPTGSDSNPGTEAQPFRTIQRAANVVSPGNTVIVEDGVYSGSNQCSNAVVCLTRGGSAGQLVTFKSRNKWGAKIDGQNGVAATGFAFGGANYVRIQDFEIYGVANAGGSASGIEVFSSGRFSPGQQGCQPSTPNWTNHDHGIYHSDGDDVTIRNNIIYRTERGWAIQAYPNSRARMNILNNTFAFTNQNTGKYGAIIIYDGMTVSDSNISNNIFYQVNGAAIYVGGSSSPSFSNVLVSNNIVQNGAILRADSSVGTGLTFNNNRENTDPGMVDPASYNFRLQASSLAIDSGVAVPVPTDHEGRTRPQGNGYDVGAYEYSSSGISSLSNIGLSFLAFNPIRITSASISQGAVALTGASPPGRSAGRRR